MQIKYSKSVIEFEKELNPLDRFVIDFCSILNKSKIKYVLIAGYISILFGRSRSSEDVDIFIEDIGFKKFESLWNNLSVNFYCLNAQNAKYAYSNYLKNNYAIRFSNKGSVIPNMELSFPKGIFGEISLNDKIKVIVNKNELYISPLELQIAFKLYLGSEKDIEDAKHLYIVFRNNLDIESLRVFNKKLKVSGIFRRYLL